MRVRRWLAVTLTLVVFAYGAYTLATGTESIPPALKVLTDGTIEVLEATYGLNCRPAADVEPGNATRKLGEVCNGTRSCDYRILVDILGDPANSCGKDFTVSWRCATAGPVHKANLSAEAHGKVAILACGGADEQ